MDDQNEQHEQPEDHEDYNPYEGVTAYGIAHATRSETLRTKFQNAALIAAPIAYYLFINPDFNLASKAMAVTAAVAAGWSWYRNRALRHKFLNAALSLEDDFDREQLTPIAMTTWKLEDRPGFNIQKNVDIFKKDVVDSIMKSPYLPLSMAAMNYMNGAGLMTAFTAAAIGVAIQEGIKAHKIEESAKESLNKLTPHDIDGP